MSTKRPGYKIWETKTNRNEGIEKSTIIVGDFSVSNQLVEQLDKKISKNIEKLNTTINQ